MIKLVFTYCFIVFLLLFCTQNNENLQLSDKEKLEIALYQSFPHFQSNAEIKLLKKYKIKTASFIKENLINNKIDSTTFLVFDNKGRILKRTTSECTTAGCLPYIIRQKFIYKNNKLLRMQNLSYKKKFKSVLPYWTLSDTNKLSKFDWEDYSYQPNIVRVESGPFIWKYQNNQHGNIVEILDSVKSTGQVSKTLIQYSDTSITLSIIHIPQDSALKITYKLQNEKVILNDSSGNEKRQTKYVFNHNGLLEKKLFFINNKLISKTSITYSNSNEK